MPKYIHDYPESFFEEHPTMRVDKKGIVKPKKEPKAPRKARPLVVHWMLDQVIVCGRGRRKDSRWTAKFHEATCATCRQWLKTHLDSLIVLTPEET